MRFHEQTLDVTKDYSLLITLNHSTLLWITPYYSYNSGICCMHVAVVVGIDAKKQIVYCFMWLIPQVTVDSWLLCLLICCSNGGWNSLCVNDLRWSHVTHSNLQFIYFCRWVAMVGGIDKWGCESGANWVPNVAKNEKGRWNLAVDFPTGLCVCDRERERDRKSVV